MCSKTLNVTRVTRVFTQIGRGVTCDLPDCFTLLAGLLIFLRGGEGIGDDFKSLHMSFPAAKIPVVFWSLEPSREAQNCARQRKFELSG